MELLKLLSTSEIVAQLICFLVLLAILKKFTWAPILKILDERKARIAAELQSVEQVKLDIARIKSDYENRLAQIDHEARQRIKEAAEEGKKLQDRMKKDAYHESQRILEHARWTIQDELATAQDALKDKIVDMTIAATQNLIQEKLGDEHDQKIIKDFLDKFENVGRVDKGSDA